MPDAGARGPARPGARAVPIALLVLFDDTTRTIDNPAMQARANDLARRIAESLWFGYQAHRDPDRIARSMSTTRAHAATRGTGDLRSLACAARVRDLSRRTTSEAEIRGRGPPQRFGADVH